MAGTPSVGCGASALLLAKSATPLSAAGRKYDWKVICADRTSACAISSSAVASGPGSGGRMGGSMVSSGSGPTGSGELRLRFGSGFTLLSGR